MEANESNHEDTLKIDFFFELLGKCGIIITKIEELEGYTIARESLLEFSKYEIIKPYLSKLKKYLSSSMYTSVQGNAELHQKSPLINLVRQVLKCLGYRMMPLRLSDGYSEDGKKRYRRIFIVKKIESLESEKV